MPINRSRTLSLIAAGALSFSLSGSLDALPNTAAFEPHPIYAFQTTSDNDIASKYCEQYESKSLREEAISLFGVQSSFTEDELKTYWKAISEKSENTPINIFDLFNC